VCGGRLWRKRRECGRLSKWKRNVTNNITLIPTSHLEASTQPRRNSVWKWRQHREEELYNPILTLILTLIGGNTQRIDFIREPYLK